MLIDVVVSEAGAIESNDVVYANDKKFVEHIMQQSTLQTRNECEVAMAILCGASGGAVCYAIYGIEAILSRIGGLGCAVGMDW